VTPVPLHAARVDEAAEMLTQAFHNDPFQSYIFPDPEERRSLSPPFFSVLLRYGVLAGEVWTIDSALRGLAVLWPPRHRELNPDA
jgi:hypothetical protein